MIRRIQERARGILPTARCRTAGRYSATRWQRDAQSVILRLTCEVFFRPSGTKTSRPSPIPRKWLSCCVRSLDSEVPFVVKCALLLAPLLIVRPGELRNAEWAGFDLEKAEWRYFVTKTKTEQLVPLAKQALETLRDLHALTGHRTYVFPGRDPKKPMSEAAINAALRRMGYDTKTEITGHGFRAMARTILHERLRFPAEVIDHQLAHKVPDTLGTAYNRTKFLDDRVAKMQAWADYLDRLKAGAEVVRIRPQAV